MVSRDELFQLFVLYGYRINALSPIDLSAREGKEVYNSWSGKSIVTFSVLYSTSSLFKLTFTDWDGCNDFSPNECRLGVLLYCTRCS